MHQEQSATYFLYRYESTSGLWVETKLAFQVSSPLLEAMNAILSKDGILAFIGTKSEFGQYRAELKDLKEADSTPSWTSLPESTILATLGLCLNPSTAEGRSLVFHGSPRLLSLWYLIDASEKDLGEIPILDDIERYIVSRKSFRIGAEMLTDLGILDDVVLYHDELQDLWTDYWCGVWGLDRDNMLHPGD